MQTINIRIFREDHSTHAVFLSVEVLNCRLMRTPLHVTSETDLLSCLKMPRQLSVRNFLVRDEAEAENK